MSHSTIDQTHDPRLTSWVDSANGHPDFPVQNLPFGVFSADGESPRPGVAIGDMILDLPAIAELLPACVTPALASDRLNKLMALSPDDRRSLRRRLSSLLSDQGHRDSVQPALRDASACQLHVPAAIGDYTDFYVGIHHATNVGKLFRPDNPLLPNYKYVPIGYHGRASSIRPSGVPMVRPKGQSKVPGLDAPVVGPSARLDFELELGIWIGRGNELGETIPIGRAAEHIAGLCLLNDWSARDFQAWEYQPLGPFLAKNFQTTISPWMVTADALAPFRIAQPPRPEGDPRPLPYLWDEGDQILGAFAIELEVWLASEQMRAAGMDSMQISRGSASNMYWTVAQIVTHHASNGCNLNPGDLLGTGTISGADGGSYGSLLEITKSGTETVELPTGQRRTFLEDGDQVLLRATARADGYQSIGFGECRAVILPARA